MKTWIIHHGYVVFGTCSSTEVEGEDIRFDEMGRLLIGAGGEVVAAWNAGQWLSYTTKEPEADKSPALANAA